MADNYFARFRHWRVSRGGLLIVALLVWGALETWHAQALSALLASRGARIARLESEATLAQQGAADVDAQLQQAEEPSLPLSVIFRPVSNTEFTLELYNQTTSALPIVIATHDPETLAVRRFSITIPPFATKPSPPGWTAAVNRELTISSSGFQDLVIQVPPDDPAKAGA